MPTPAEELATLRTTNAELVEKSNTRKARITELEAQVVDLTSKLATSQTALQDATVGTPLHNLAASISAVPELWELEFAKHYKLEMRNGKLTVLDSNGEPIVDDKQQPIPFTDDAIAKLVTDASSPGSKVFAHITATVRASGGGATNDKASTTSGQHRQQKSESAKPTAQFGLR